MRSNEKLEYIKAKYLSMAKTPWDKELLYYLNEISWDQLFALNGITPESYRTIRLITNTENIESIDLLAIDLRKEKKKITIELLPNEVTKDFGLDFANKEEITLRTKECIEEAINQYIYLCPDLYSSIESFVSIIHIVKAENDDYDISFTDPEIPHSIFISVPKMKNTKSVLRVAESIVHETMHLQLTLLEKIIPMVTSGDSPSTYYSPWKGPNRQARGLLHAIYVFKTILDFWKKVIDSTDDATVHAFAKVRCEEIEQQLKETSNFAGSSDLTIEGRQFIKRIYED